MYQRKYVLDMLKETSMIDYKLVDIPMDPNVKTGRASMRSKEISRTSGETKLPHHHPTRHFLYCERN